jgi:hypothetical protein
MEFNKSYFELDLPTRLSLMSEGTSWMQSSNSIVVPHDRTKVLLRWIADTIEVIGSLKGDSR